MFKFLFICLIIVLIICIVYYVLLHKKRKRVRRLLDKSNGTFDTSARAALNELSQIKDKTADDYFLSGSVLQHNLLENTLKETPHTKYILDNIIDDYSNAARLLSTNDDHEIAPEFIVARIDEFVDIYNTYNEPLHIDTAAAYNNTIAHRKQESITAASNKKEAADIYLDSAVKFTSDPQNVHDSKVNNDLRMALFKIKSTYSDRSPKAILAEINDYIDDNINDINNGKASRAKQALEIARKGDYITTFNDSEDKILSYVWDRCRDHNSREAVINALAESIENNSPVCINGRCARMINALSSIDPEIDSPLTYEAYKNQIYQESREIIEQEVERAKNGADKSLSAAANAFTGNGSIDEETERKLISVIKKEISDNIDKYQTKLSDKEISQLKEECYAAI